MTGATGVIIFGERALVDLMFVGQFGDIAAADFTLALNTAAGLSIACVASSGLIGVDGEELRNIDAAVGTAAVAITIASGADGDGLLARDAALCTGLGIWVTAPGTFGARYCRAAGVIEPGHPCGGEAHSIAAGGVIDAVGTTVLTPATAGFCDHAVRIAGLGGLRPPQFLAEPCVATGVVGDKWRVRKDVWCATLSSGKI